MESAVAHPSSVLGEEPALQLHHLPLFLQVPERIVSLGLLADN